MRVNYYEYIKSDEWRKRADAAKQRAGFRCQVCNRAYPRMLLNAHHRTYERLGHEDPNDITVLCRDCHELYELNKKIQRPPQPAPPKKEEPPTTQKPKSNSVPANPSAYSITPSEGHKSPTPYEYRPRTISPIQPDSINKPKSDMQPDQTAKQSKQVISTEGKPYRITRGDIIALTGILLVIGLLVVASLFTSRPVRPKPTPTYTLSDSGLPHATQTSEIMTAAEITHKGNIRSHPRSSSPVIGTLEVGTKVVISGYITCGPITWLQIGRDQWILGHLVDDLPLNVPGIDIDCSSILDNEIATVALVPTPIPVTPTPLPTTIAPPSTDNATNTVIQPALVCSNPCSCSPVVRTITKGTQVTVLETSRCGNDIWYRISEDEWLGPHLINSESFDMMISSTPDNRSVEVTNVPTPTPLELPTAIPTPTFTPIPPTLQPPTATQPPKQPTPTPTMHGCAGGCFDYPSWCAPPIKGNVSYDTGERIYHVSGQEYYDDTVINPAYGERWFCTEQEAKAAGWRKSRQ